MERVLNGHAKTEDERKHLSPIRIDMKRFKQQEQRLYRVYSAPGEYRIIEADSAHEAYQKSGVARVHKIERESFYRYVALRSDQIEATDQGMEFNTELPEMGDIREVLIAALADLPEQQNLEQRFEALGFGDLTQKKPDLPVEMPAPRTEEAVNTVSFAAAPDADEDADPLTPEEVNKLLNEHG